MSIRITAYSCEVGTSHQLEMAQGEDREFRPTFTDGGTPVDFTGAQAIVLTIRNRVTEILLLSRNYSGFQGLATAGTPRFQILQSDTSTQSVGPYDVDISWTDASGYQTQLQAVSTFELLERIGEPGDAVTTPPAIPVVYGLNWLPGLWSTPTGGYQVNDAVQAEDGSLGATAISTFRALLAGVTYYPIGPTQAVATGWAYVGQHGGIGATGPKSDGTVTSITAGTGLTGGTITSTGTISIDSTVVTLTDSQTLTNKTISSPVLSGTATGSYTLSGSPTIQSSVADGAAAVNVIIDSLNSLSNAGAKNLSFRNGGAEMFSISPLSNLPVWKGTGGAFYYSDTQINPFTDGNSSVGTPSLRWGTINAMRHLGAEQTINAAATLTIDPTAGESIRLLLSATAINIGGISAANGSADEVIHLSVIQDSAGGRTLLSSNFSSSFVFSNGTYVATPTANKRDIITFKWDVTASKWYQMCPASQNL